MNSANEIQASLPGVRIDERSSPAVSFVQACGHASLEPSSLQALYQRGAQLSESEWNEVLGYALLERMECLTYAHSVAAGLSFKMPGHIRETFSKVYRGTLVTNLKMRNCTLALVDALESHGVQVVCIKGIALALRYYGDIAHRPMGDIDLLVRWSDVEMSAAVLLELGFRPKNGVDRPFAFQSLRNRVLVFERADGHIVEVHWALASLPPYARRLEATDVWSRVQELSIKGHSVHYLHPYDELRYLCFHYAAQHKAQRLLWLVDIVEMLPSAVAKWQDEAPWRWEEFVSETTLSGMALPVAVTLARAQRLLGARLPEDVLNELSRAAQSPRERMGWRSAIAHPYHPALLLRYLLALDGPRQRLAFLGGALRLGLPVWARWLAHQLIILVPIGIRPRAYQVARFLRRPFLEARGEARTR